MLMLISVIPMQVFATNTQQNLSADISTENEKLPSIEEEIIGERTLNSKVFTTNDGGYYSIVAASPIHVEDENGELQNIIEPSQNLKSEANIAEFVSQEADAYLNQSNISLLDSEVETEDSYQYNVSTLIKCFGPSGADTSGFYVQGTNKGNKSVYIKPYINQSNILITSAKVSANAIGISQTSVNLVVAQNITSDWNDLTDLKPTIASKYFDAVQVAKSSTMENCSWDITSSMNSWVLGLTSNNGIALSPLKNKKTCDVKLSNIMVSYYYHNINETDEKFTYEQVDMGTAGDLYINHFSCLPILKNDDIGIEGEKSPVQISHIYNSLNSNTVNAVGQNFRINYSSTLHFVGNNTYSWKTISGENINFTFSSEESNIKTYNGKDSKKDSYSLYLSKDSATNKYNYINYNNLYIKSMEDNKIYKFETHSDIGYLSQIEDGSINSNTCIINYNFYDEYDELHTSDDIQSITDGVGRKYEFNYELTDNNRTSYLKSISVYNSLGNKIKVGSGDSKEDYTVNYLYEIREDKAYLSSVQYVGETADAYYSYDEFNRLATISNGEQKLTLSYCSTDSNKLSSYKIVQIIDDSETTLEEVTIDSSLVYKRIFTNQNNESKIINFDNEYNPVYYQDYDGNILFGVCENGETEIIYDDPTTQNLVKNGDFEDVDDSEYPVDWISTEDVEYGIDYEAIDGNALEIKGDIYGNCRVHQRIDAPEGTKFAKNDTYAYGGFSKAPKALTSNGNHTYGIYIFDSVKTEDDQIIPNECISYFNFDDTLQEWQQKKSYFELKNDTPALFIYICYDKNYNGEKAYFDNIQLYEFDPVEKDDIIDPYDYTRNDNNSVISRKLKSKDKNRYNYLETTYRYNQSQDDNYLSEITDENGITTYYQYDADNGQLVSYATGIKDDKKTFEYTASGMLSLVEQTVTDVISGNTKEIKTSYGYLNNNLTSVTHNGFSYNLTYDNYDNITSIGVSTASAPFETRMYSDAAAQQIDKIEYANGDKIQYIYDDNDRIKQIDYYGYKNDPISGKKSFTYTYGDSGEITSISDNISELKMIYNDDEYKLVSIINDSDTVLYRSYVNDDGNTVEEFNQVNGYATTNIILQNTVVENDDLDVVTTSNETLSRTGILDDDSTVVNYSHDKQNITDEFGRLKSNKLTSTLTQNGGVLNVNCDDVYTYNHSEYKQTTLVSSYQTIKESHTFDEYGEQINMLSFNVTYNYSYDSKGNITKIVAVDNMTNTSMLYGAYKYDEANQLIFEYSPLKGYCVQYSYDIGGNITCKRMYDLAAYDIESNEILSGAEYEDIEFAYATDFKDRLASVNGINIDYDANNNPINYSPSNGTLEWSGRLLTAFISNTEKRRYEYEYDANGYRTKKTIYELVLDDSGEEVKKYESEINYVWKNGILNGFALVNKNNNPTYSYVNIIYDESGVAQGYVGITGTQYYFVRDGLGNVTNIVDATGEINIEISYDAWGNPTFPNPAGDFSDIVLAIICAMNPKSYKGYIYDYESGLYYCQSRYYSPAWSRFLNMDEASILNAAQGETLGANLFAYCDNNPVNNVDPDGKWAQNYSGFKWTPTGFNVNIRTAFLSRPFCLSYAWDILHLRGSWSWRGKTYRNMDALRIAVELFAHGVGYYAGRAVNKVNSSWGKGLIKSGKYVEVNNNDSRAWQFYAIWYAAGTLKNVARAYGVTIIC